MCLKSKTGFGQTWSNDKLNYLKWKTFDTKLLEIIKIQTFYINHFSIWESLSKQYSQNLEFDINYIKLYVRIVDFKLHFPNTLSNTKLVSLLNVDLDEWNNIGIHDFSSWDPLVFRKPVRGYEFFQNSKLSATNLVKWPIWWLQMKKFLNTNLLEIMKIYIWYIVHFSIWIF